MNSRQEDWFDGPGKAPSERSSPRPDEKAGDSQIMYVDVDGFEGPLDLLLELARRQKVDLAAISVLALAEQYLGYIETVRKRRIEVAADYLVMAAWLAYLKSRLMVPQAPGDEEPSGEMMAAILQFRLKRLEAMRNASSQLMGRPRLGLQVYDRGDPEAIDIARKQEFKVSLFDLLKAYGSLRERTCKSDYALQKRSVWSLKEARTILERLIGEGGEWMALERYLTQYLASPEDRATVLASSFSASLELVREGQLEMRQTLSFGPLLIRRRKQD